MKRALRPEMGTKTGSRRGNSSCCRPNGVLQGALQSLFPLRRRRLLMELSSIFQCRRYS
jgi:hypothetical protein